MRRHQGVHQTSPERTRPCAETPTKPPLKQQQQQQQQQGRKVSVVYYLCNNRHLEHPHFMEVPLAFPEDLYLKDVINRLNVLRGKGMAAMYSWSCKRGYKNGFVWHDIGEDDLILPAHGSEYVLKGSELLDQSPPDRNHNAMINPRIQNMRNPRHVPPPPPPPPPPLPPPPPPPSQPDEILPFTNRSSSFESLSAEPGCRSSPPSAMGSPGIVDFRLKDPITVQNASTQTDGQRRRKKNEATLRSKEAAETVEEERSQKLVSSNTCSSPSGKASTLESLIREEYSHRNDLRIVEEEEVFSPTRAKLKATDMLVQLITCGAISVKDHYSFGIVPTYKPRFLRSSPSPMFSGSITMPADEIVSSSQSQRVIGFSIEENNNNFGGIEEGSSTVRSSLHEEGIAYGA